MWIIASEHTWLSHPWSWELYIRNAYFMGLVTLGLQTDILRYNRSNTFKMYYLMSLAHVYTQETINIIINPSLLSPKVSSWPFFINSTRGSPDRSLATTELFCVSPTLCDPMDYSLSGSSCPRNSPGKNTRVGCHFLLQRISLTQGSNLGLLHSETDSKQSEPPGLLYIISSFKNVIKLELYTVYSFLCGFF